MRGRETGDVAAARDRLDGSDDVETKNGVTNAESIVVGDVLNYLDVRRVSNMINYVTGGRGW